MIDHRYSCRELGKKEGGFISGCKKKREIVKIHKHVHRCSVKRWRVRTKVLRSQRVEKERERGKRERKRKRKRERERERERKGKREKGKERKRKFFSFLPFFRSLW